MSKDAAGDTFQDAKGSKNCTKVAHLHAEIDDYRPDNLHKRSLKLINENPVVGLATRHDRVYNGFPLVPGRRPVMSMAPDSAMKNDKYGPDV